MLLPHLVMPQVVGLYGDMATGVDLGHEEAYRLVAVLRKPMK